MRRTIAATVVVVGAIYLLRLDGVAGLIKDDAWYILLAKALATGQGYKLISSAAAQILPTVPPGFPALLAPVFWINPSFPDNVWLLKLVSIAALAIAAVACYFDFTRHRQVDPPTAVALVAIVFLTPAIVFLATSTVMSDCVFLAFQLVAVVAIERAVRDDPSHAATAVAAAILTAITYLVRITGLALIAAALGYFVTRRRYREAAIFAAVVLISVMPWELYARSHQPTAQDRDSHGGSIAYPYIDLVSRQGADRGTPLGAGIQIRRAFYNVAGVATRDIGALLLPMLYRGADESGEEVISVGEAGRGSMGSATGTAIVSLAFVAVMAIGIWRARALLSLPVLLMAATVAMIASVGSLTFRYLVPLTPFVVLYVSRGIPYKPAVRVLIATLLAFQLIDHAGYLVARSQGRADWLADNAEVGEVLSRLTSDPGDAAVASTNPALVYLRTGRKGIYAIDPDANWERWRSWNVNYVAALQPLQLPSHARQSPTLFKTGRKGLWLVEMNKR